MSNQPPPHPGQPGPNQPSPGQPHQDQLHQQDAQYWSHQARGQAHPQGQPTSQGGAGAYGQGQPYPPGQQYGQNRTQWDPTQPFPQPGQPGRDPRAPMGAPIPAAVGIEQFQQKRSRTPVVATIAVLALVALGIVLGTRAMSRPAAAPASSVAPSITVTPQSTAGNNALSVPFDNDIDDASGTWTITNYEWSGDSLLVTLSVHVDKGTQAMRFFAISNDSETRSYDPASSGRADDLLNKQAPAGSTLKGTVRFAMPHQPSTIFLTAANGRQVSALVVPA